MDIPSTLPTTKPPVTVETADRVICSLGTQFLKSLPPQPYPPTPPTFTVLEERRQPEGELGLGKSAPMFVACLVSGRKAGNRDIYKIWRVCPPLDTERQDFFHSEDANED